VPRACKNATSTCGCGKTKRIDYSFFGMVYLIDYDYRIKFLENFKTSVDQLATYAKQFPSLEPRALDVIFVLE
jgi:hypothetical protein